VDESHTFDLHLVPGFFDHDTCERLIGEMRASPASPALTYGKGESGSVDDRIRKVAWVVPSSETARFVKARLIAYQRKIEDHFGLQLRDCEDPQFLCYQAGDFFVAHQDGNTGMLKLETESRRVSVSIFLNNQSELDGSGSYSGGSLVFSDWRTGESCLLTGEAGMLVAFPSELTHEITPVTHGERYAIVSWFR
jgi:SM-20-related protein